MPLPFLRPPKIKKGVGRTTSNTSAPELSRPQAAEALFPGPMTKSEDIPPPPPQLPTTNDPTRSPGCFSFHTVESAMGSTSTCTAITFIENGDWEGATQLIQNHPEEASTWASIKSRSASSRGTTTSASNTSSPVVVSTVRRLPLHHACLKLRNCPNKQAAADLINALLLAYPDAAKERETKHGCLPIHLVAFALSSSSSSSPYSSSFAIGGGETSLITKTLSHLSSQHNNYDNNINSNTVTTSNDDEEISLSIVRNLLNMYPKACRETSEGGRLPLHMACAGRASPGVVRELLRHYGTDAARHRTKDGYLPLHLVALHGCSSEEVPIMLLRKYPDAAVGRNKFDRIPLEEALFAAGENGRPKQEELVKVLRKHPSYWVSSINRPAPLGQRRVASEGACVVEPVTAIGLQSLPNHFPQHFLLQHEKNDSSGHILNDNYALATITSRSLQSSNGSTTESSELTSLIKSGEWEACKERCRKRPNEAVERLTIQSRSGATIRCTPIHYLLERSPPLFVVQAIVNAASAATKSNPKDTILKDKTAPGGALPLHVACTWGASSDIISYLLKLYPDSSKQKDSGGNLPLHQACYSGASFQVVEELVKMWPDGIIMKNGSGSTPLDIVERLQHANKENVISLLKQWKEKTDFKGGGVEV